MMKKSKTRVLRFRATDELYGQLEEIAVLRQVPGEEPNPSAVLRNLVAREHRRLVKSGRLPSAADRGA